MFNLNNANPGGADTIYALSTVAGQLLKYTFSGGSWSSSGSIASTAQDITGVASGGTVTLYMTVTGTLSTLTDSSGYGGALAGSPTTVVAAPTNEGFRGLEYVIPEPSVAGLAALGLLGLAIRRRARR